MGRKWPALLRWNYQLIASGSLAAARRDRDVRSMQALISVPECSSAVSLPSGTSPLGVQVEPGRACVSRGARRLCGVHRRYRSGSAVVTSSR
jgi:hypothetical protein